MAPLGCALLNNEPSALAINVADETIQTDLGEHIATLVITYLLLCGGVLLDGLRRHTRRAGHGQRQQRAQVGI
jgi:hypothetical protein